MRNGKGLKFVGDSRVVAKDKKDRNTTPKDYSVYPGRTEAFWPNFLLKEWMVGSVFLVGFLCLVAAHPAPLERIADPTDTSYIPMPDWYFLFLYQLLKFSYASGPYAIVGSMIIPGLAFGALLLAPFIDRGPDRQPRKRIYATGFMLLAVTSIFYLTWDAAAHHDWEAAKKQGQIVLGPKIDKAAAGYKIYSDNGCISCHGDSLQGGAGPKLAGTTLTEEEIADYAKNGSENGKMPAGVFKGTEEELKTLTAYIVSLK